jgi:hypothetical protein
MRQPQRWQPQDLRSPQRQLLDWIDEVPNSTSEKRFERIKTLRFRPEELDSATDHAFRLYTKWYAEDLRRLWSLFESKSGPEALEALRQANQAFWNLALDRQTRAHAFVLIPRLCWARWDLRENTDQAASGR